MLPKTIVKRMPKVVNILVAFIKHIVRSPIIFRIKSLDNIYLGGRGVGCHVAGNVGNKLKDSFPGQMVAMIWGNFMF